MATKTITICDGCGTEISGTSLYANEWSGHDDGRSLHLAVVATDGHPDPSGNNDREYPTVHLDLCETCARNIARVIQKIAAKND